jgi:hypothetical protein
MLSVFGIGINSRGAAFSTLENQFREEPCRMETALLGAIRHCAEFQNESGVANRPMVALCLHFFTTLERSITRILISRKRVTAVLRTQTAVCPRLRDCAGKARAEVSDSLDRASPERLWAIPFTRSEPDGSFNSEVRIEMAARGCGPPHFPPGRCGEESLRSERGSGYPSSPRRWRLLGRGLRSAHH